MPLRSDANPHQQGFGHRSFGWWLVVAAATVIAAIARRLTPGDGDFWRDEALFIFVSRITPTGELLRYLHQHESHPPLYYLMMRAWTAVAGTGDAALRALPLILGVLLVPLVAWIGARAFGSVAGLVAAILVAVHPNLAYHSAQVRPYAALVLPALVSTYALWRLVETRRWSTVAVYVVATLAMLYLHHWSWVLLAAQGLALVIVAWLGAPVRDWAPRAGIAWAAVGLGYVPLVPTFLRHARVAGHPGEELGPLDALARFSDVTVGQLENRLGVAVLLLAAGAMLMRRGGRSHGGDRRLRAYALLGLVPPLAVGIALSLSGSSSLMVPHTLTTLIPFVAMGLGAAIAALLEDRRFVECALLIGLLATALLYDFGRLQRTGKTNAGMLAEALEGEARPTDVVVMAPDLYAPSFNYYFDPRFRQVDYPSGGRREVVHFDDYYQRIADTATLAALEDSIRAFERRGSRVWFVSNAATFSDTAPLPDRLPPVNSPQENTASYIRGRQVERMIRGIYGRPDSLIVPGRETPLLEALGAERFEPDTEGR